MNTFSQTVRITIFLACRAKNHDLTEITACDCANIFGLPVFTVCDCANISGLPVFTVCDCANIPGSPDFTACDCANIPGSPDFTVSECAISSLFFELLSLSRLFLFCFYDSKGSNGCVFFEFCTKYFSIRLIQPSPARMIGS